eukprot:CAMPEP_0182556560 /NCGR_PEP_ID=MMETSP1324-20130603/786_1 /TAXON_ID=236786 /ORGANISM="Florenciella sp., Strain RCC1587" /LENGTH=38 /DNA_ID= /DNA_START= /DNA_END= /DNA_ORIENTATION=
MTTPQPPQPRNCTMPYAIFGCCSMQLNYGVIIDGTARR